MKIKRPRSKSPIPKNAKKVFSGDVLEVYQWKQKMFDGSYKLFHKIKRADSVNVLPIIDGKIILTRQRQPGRKEFISSIGGRMEEGESVLDTARRELMEESGITAEKFELWFSFQPYEGTDWAVYTFIAKGAKKTGKAKLDNGEKIKLISVTFDEYVKLAAKENFRDKEISLKIFQAMGDKKLMAKYRKMFVG